ncbi:DUF6265 family protein [Pararcticibacter amylolyticus]|uniref:DUF6265 domain-containing protein n=1 Tax=Pararcticibacter amylolyticus TaxID=2173175 RepID=A0A2U2PKV2_9SPHI|nr:DUF6265 family protein [Pararcticibacter amylolyticus]PWG82031.1 hypothetical protein DDR33_03135 [Pararcticibacter amylolyticus]
MHKIGGHAFILILLSGCSFKISNRIGKAEWLTGTWEMTTKKGNVYESWKKINKDEFSGKSYILKNRDTIILETVKLVQKGDSLFYIPTVREQNDGLPVHFSMKSVSGKKIIFENPSHDFPQVISYTRTGKDSLMAQISGMQNGRQRNERFPMRRVK